MTDQPNDRRHLADPAVPADATDLDAWTAWEDGGHARMFDTTWRRNAGPMRVTISGIQYADGRVRRWIMARPFRFGDDGEMGADQARALAAVLHAAADAIEAL